MRRKINIKKLLKALNIPFKEVGNKLVASCPNPAHIQDRNREEWFKWIESDSFSPSWSILDDLTKKHGSHFCHVCKFGGGPLELARCFGLEELPTDCEHELLTQVAPVDVVVNDAKRKQFKLPLGVEIPGPEGKWYEPALRYLKGRGITRDQCDRFGLGYAIWGRLANRVVFPVYTNGELCTYAARAFSNVDKRYDAGLKIMGAKPDKALFGHQLIDRNQNIITVAEGCPSVLSLDRAGAINPVGLLGSNVSPMKLRILSEFEEIIVATDPDPAGDSAYSVIRSLSRYCNVKRLKLRKSPDDLSTEELKDNLHKLLHDA